jgi:hypothetical protein
VQHIPKTEGFVSFLVPARATSTGLSEVSDDEVSNSLGDGYMEAVIPAASEFIQEEKSGSLYGGEVQVQVQKRCTPHLISSRALVVPTVTNTSPTYKTKQL